MITFVVFFFFQAEDGIRDVAVTGVQTCALPISTYGTTGSRPSERAIPGPCSATTRPGAPTRRSTTGITRRDRKSTRLNSSHGYISYAVFCLKKKKKKKQHKKPTNLTTYVLQRH